MQVRLTRMQHGGRAVVLASFKDMADLRAVNQRLARLELKHRQLELLHKIASQVRY